MLINSPKVKLSSEVFLWSLSGYQAVVEVLFEVNIQQKFTVSSDSGHLADVFPVSEEVLLSENTAGSCSESGAWEVKLDQLEPLDV